jgi:hypothetical protein
MKRFPTPGLGLPLRLRPSARHSNSRLGRHFSSILFTWSYHINRFFRMPSTIFPSSLIISLTLSFRILSRRVKSANYEANRYMNLYNICPHVVHVFEVVLDAFESPRCAYYNQHRVYVHMIRTEKVWTHFNASFTKIYPHITILVTMRRL